MWAGIIFLEEGKGRGRNVPLGNEKAKGKEDPYNGCTITFRKRGRPVSYNLDTADI